MELFQSLSTRFTIVIFLTSSVIAISMPALLHRAKRWNPENYPSFDLHFDCQNRPVGFYADVEHACQVFHMCLGDGIRVPHICPNNTAFNQQYRVCDWAYNVDCPDSPNWYYLNDLTYATDANDDTYF